MVGHLIYTDTLSRTHFVLLRVVESDATPLPHGLPDHPAIDVTTTLPPQSPPPPPKPKRKKLDPPPPLPESFRSARLRKLHEQRQETARGDGEGPQVVHESQSSMAPHVPAAPSSKGGTKKKG